MRTHHLPIALAVLLAAALFAGGCSSGFQREWKSSAVSGATDGQRDDHVTGRWKGSWKSDKSGHSGGLRCVARKTGDDSYRCHFDATYALLLRFGYMMDMTADVREDVTYVAGEQDLGKSYGGLYEYEGESDGKTFRLNYKTNNDYGHFTLKRP
jgi:hypothetical protein